MDSASRSTFFIGLGLFGVILVVCSGVGILMEMSDSNEPEWYSDDITDKNVFIHTASLSVNTYNYQSSKIDDGFLKLKKSSGVEFWIKLDEITNIQWGY